MADYQSSLLADQIESVLTGAVVFNRGTDLTENQKAQARENIGATAYGQGIRIKAHFDTLDDLLITAEKPSAGDAYSVGNTLPYDLYIYDYLHARWVKYGAIRATDVSARFSQDVTVAASEWEKDDSVFQGFAFKASIPIPDVSANDFPIVAFSPSDAVSGNFCPVAYTFDGIVQIFAREKPTSARSIPAITVTVQR